MADENFYFLYMNNKTVSYLKSNKQKVELPNDLFGRYNFRLVVIPSSLSLFDSYKKKLFYQ